MSMHRELNPQLFGAKAVVEKIGSPVDQQQPATSILGKSPEQQAQSRQVPYPPVDIKAIEHQIATLKMALMQMEKRTDSIVHKIDELGRNVHNRLERFSAAILRFEENQSQQNQDATAKFAHIIGKVNDRKITETKVQELVDRHNMMIRNFENRLTSLQRLVSEQEMALHNSQAALEEARSEIARLKRG